MLTKFLTLLHRTHFVIQGWALIVIFLRECVMLGTAASHIKQDSSSFLCTVLVSRCTIHNQANNYNSMVCTFGNDTTICLRFMLLWTCKLFFLSSLLVALKPSQKVRGSSQMRTAGGKGPCRRSQASTSLFQYVLQTLYCDA